MRRLARLAVGLALLAGVAAALSGGGTQAKTRWVITDLGTPRNYASSQAIAINERRHVVIEAVTTDHHMHFFLWESGKLRDLGKVIVRPDNRDAINNRGQVLGDNSVWQNGNVTKLGTLGGGLSKSADLNDRGQVVGWSYPRKGKSHNCDFANCNHAFLWQDGRMRDLGTLGGGASAAEAINEHGQVVGEADTRATDWAGDDLHHAFLWQDGKMRDLGTLGGPGAGRT